MKYKTIAATAVIAVAGVLAGCFGGTTSVRIECDSQSVGTKCGVVATQTWEHKPGDTSSTANLELEISTTGAQVVNTSGQALVKLFKNTTLVAAQRFAYTVAGTRVYPTNPESIDAWVRSFGSTVNKANLILDDLEMVSPTGESIESTMQVTIFYAGTQKATASSMYTYDRWVGGTKYEK